MNSKTDARERATMLYGLLPLLILSDSAAVGIVLGVSFMFCYIVTTVFLLFRKDQRPQLKFSLILFFIISICLSLMLSITRIINPFLFELVFLKVCVIPLVPVLFKIQFAQSPKDHDWGLRELLYGLLFSFLILFTGFLREFLVSFSLYAIFNSAEKAIPVFPIFNQPAGAFLLIGLALGLGRFIRQKKGISSE